MTPNKITSEQACNEIVDFLTKASLADIASIYSKYVVDSPVIITECEPATGESPIYLKGRIQVNYPYRNKEGSIFWTGLPVGDENDKVIAKGTDFIVYTLPDDPGKTYCFIEENREKTQEFLQKTDWGDWHRCRAMTAEEAVERYWNCQDQWRYFENCPEGYVPTEGEVQNLVLLPLEDRPEIPR